MSDQLLQEIEDAREFVMGIKERHGRELPMRSDCNMALADAFIKLGEASRESFANNKGALMPASKWKHCRTMREIFACYVASRCGYAQSEADINAMVTGDCLSPEEVLRRFRGGKAERQRVELALHELVSKTEAAACSEDHDETS